MYNNTSNVRLPKHFPIQTLTPLQLKTLSKFRRGTSTNSISNRVSSISNRLSVSNRASNISNRGSHTNSRKSKSRTKVSGKSSGQWSKGKSTPKKNLNIVGDALVAKLDTDNEKGLLLELNGNEAEPFSEQISKDVALAVAMIVAEHEMIKAKQKEEEIKKKKALKLAAKEKEKEASGTCTPQKAEVGKEKTVVKAEINLPTQQYHRSKTSIEKGLAQTNSNLVNNNVPSSAAPPTPHADKQKDDSEPETDGKCVIKKKSSVTFSVPSKTMVAAIPSRPPTATETELPKKKRSATLSATSSRKSTTTALPPSTASAASSLSTTGSNYTVTYPPLPSIGAKMGGQLEVLKYLGRVQNYMNHLGYHRYGEPKIHINSRLSMKMQMVTAREMMQSGLPIKCLHAVVLAVHFTNCLDTVERFPIYFRSHVSNKEYKHIVLGIYVQGHFGALGISRDCGLQDKPATYAKLSDLIFEFAKCYGQSGHILNEVKLGNIITHDQHSLERLFTKNYVIPICGCLHSDIEKNVEKFAKQLRAKMGLACLKSLRLDSANSSRFTRSRSSLIGNSVCGSGAGSCSTMRTRTISMIPLRGSKIEERSNNNSKRSSKQASKVTITRSKPTILSKKK